MRSVADSAPSPAVYATCPQSKDVETGEEYEGRVAEVARWSEAAGCAGILVYTDNSLVDPWLVAQLVVKSTDRLVPLVAVQPAYMHPYAAAKMVATIGYVHGRKLSLNLVAGGFRNDLAALDDATPHDERYARVTEYGLIVKRLLAGERVTFEGRHYTVRGLTLAPVLSADLQPEVFISGSSAAGLSAADEIGAVPIKYPRRPSDEVAQQDGPAGVRVGIVTRADAAEAWRVAHERFPEDRKGQITHGLAMKASDSEWHRQLSEMGAQEVDEADPYWLWPFENYSTFCPYLVGDYDRVAAELRRYSDLGFGTFILDIPPSEEELGHIGEAFARAHSA